MKPTTLEETLSMVPTHWLLTPGVDFLQEGDEVYLRQNDTWVEPFDIRSAMFERLVVPTGLIFRRPIPQDVRERVAKLMVTIVESGIELEASAAFPLEAWILAGKP